MNQNITLIQCNENCRYCCDGMCTLGSISKITNLAHTGCIYQCPPKNSNEKIILQEPQLHPVSF